MLTRDDTITLIEPSDPSSGNEGTNVVHENATPPDTPDGPGARREVVSDGRPNPGSGTPAGHNRREVDSNPPPPNNGNDPISRRRLVSDVNPPPYTGTSAGGDVVTRTIVDNVNPPPYTGTPAGGDVVV